MYVITAIDKVGEVLASSCGYFTRLIQQTNRPDGISGIVLSQEKLTMPSMLGVPAAEYAGSINDLRKKLRSKNGAEWLAAFKRFLRKENSWPTVQAVFRGISALIKEGGYRILDNWISDEHAPTYRQPDSEAEVEYLDLGYCKSSEIAVQRMADRGYRPAEDPEVVRDLNKHPNLLVYDNPVVVLGSVWQDRHGERLVLIFVRGSDGRYVSLRWWRNGWHARCRFAAVKVSP